MATVIQPASIHGNPGIEDAVVDLIERQHLLVEPAGAASLAAAEQERARLRGRRVVLVLSGANVTRAQLDALIAGVAGSQSGGLNAQVNVGTGTSTDAVAPVITVQGNNPANINVGDTYGDLGALVSDNVDQNLGIHAEACSQEPVACSQFESPELIVLDTSAPNVFTITYSATDQAGNTGTAERTVNVLSPLSIVVDVTATSTTATSTPAEGTPSQTETL